VSEYRFVEKPFLDQLEVLGWEVIDQGRGIPKNLAASYRTDFREVVLKDVFKLTISKLNRTEDGQERLNDKQLRE